MEATETQENTLVEVSVSMNTTANGASSSSCSRLINPVADKIGQTIAYNFLVRGLVEKTDKYADRKYGYV